MNDPSQYSISQVGKSYLPLFIPWHHEQRVITSGFNPAAVEGMGDPWKAETPFSSVWSLPCEALVETGTARETETYTVSNSNASDHSSGRLSIAVGNAVVKAGAAASYDRMIQETNSTSQASSQSKFRCGRILLLKDPPLSALSIELLLSRDGLELFEERYGSYFVAGYVLGADSGACLGASNSTRMMTESITKEITVKVLWNRFTTSSTTTASLSSYHMNLEFHGYDTLTDQSLTLRAMAGEPIEHIHAAARSCTESAKRLQERLSERLAKVGIQNGKRISVGNCAGHAEAGVVVELILMPFRTLKEYAECVFRGQGSRSAGSDLQT